MSHPVVSREEWLKVRKDHLTKERAMFHALDDLRAQRRALPWVKIEKDYTFDGPDGKVTLAELFGPRNQLAIYHFMLTPGSSHICKGCSFVSDHVDAARQHFEHADLSFAAVSRASMKHVTEVKNRMGWEFAWVSSGESDFNYDFGVSFTEEDRKAGTAEYNYGVTKIENSPDMFGVSIFIKEGGEIFHTYSTYHRGVDLLIGAMAWLDLTPKGRGENGQTHRWLKLHDDY